MRCHSCKRLSFSLICRKCRQLYLQPQLHIRKLGTGLEVVSFYSYEDIEPFLLTKHLPHGWFIYRILAKETFRDLSKIENSSFVIPIDDNLHGSYSHTAILANELKNFGYTPLFNTIHSKNKVSYSGQSLSFRINNPRKFIYRGPKYIDTILVDDIVTTGITLQEAHTVLLKYGVKVHFAFVLADINRNIKVQDWDYH